MVAFLFKLVSVSLHDLPISLEEARISHILMI